MKKRKPPMDESHQPQVDEARKRILKRPIHPGVRIVSKGKVRDLQAPHDNDEAWAVMVYDAFGTRSQSVAKVFMHHILGLCSHEWTDGAEWQPSEAELNAMLSMINSIRPKTEIEAALAAQICAVHMMTMRLAGAALSHSENWVDVGKAALAAKLARTFAVQLEALAKVKGRVGKQRITVRYERHDHKHVHLREGVGEIRDQPLAPTRRGPGRSGGAEGIEHESRPALSGRDPEWEALPRPGRQRQGAL